VTVLAALWGTLHALPDIYARVTYDFASVLWPRVARWNFRAFQAVVVFLIFLPTLYFIWSKRSFAELTQVIAFLSTNLGVALVAFAGLYLNFRLPPRYRTRGWVIILAVAATALVTLSFLVSGWGLAQKYLP